MTSLTLVLAGLGALGWWRWWKASTHECEAQTQVLVPWVRPDLNIDFPSRDYVSTRCVDKTCDAEIHIPVKVRINHKNGVVVIDVKADPTDVMAHELAHEWS